MSARKHSFFRFILIAIPVLLIIAGSLTLAGKAMMENLRYSNAVSQILSLVSEARTIAAGQKGFAQNPGEDLWADLERVEQRTFDHINPWGAEVRAVTVAGSAIRIESDMPTHDCRRLALYLLARQPAELGLLSIDAQPGTTAPAQRIYPDKTGRKSELVAEIGCGHMPDARMALVFGLRLGP